MANGFVSWELQKAVVAALIADATIKSLVGDPARVFDWVDPDADLPYITVGDSVSDNAGAKDGIEMQDHIISFNVFSAKGGREEIKLIQAAIFNALNFAALTLDTGDLVICIQYTTSEDTKEDTQRYSGTISFSAITQKA